MSSRTSTTHHRPAPPAHHHTPSEEQLLLNEMQVLLAEKRTYYAMFRSGLTVFTMPLTVLGFLLATTTYHKFFSTTISATILVIGFLGISAIGLGSLVRAEHKLQRLEKYIRTAKGKSKRLQEIVF